MFRITINQTTYDISLQESPTKPGYQDIILTDPLTNQKFISPGATSKQFLKNKEMSNEKFFEEFVWPVMKRYVEDEPNYLEKYYVRMEENN